MGNRRTNQNVSRPYESRICCPYRPFESIAGKAPLPTRSLQQPCNVQRPGRYGNMQDFFSTAEESNGGPFIGNLAGARRDFL